MAGCSAVARWTASAIIGPPRPLPQALIQSRTRCCAAFNGSGHKANASASVLNAIGATAGETAGDNIESPSTRRYRQHKSRGKAWGELRQICHGGRYQRSLCC